MPKLPLSQKGFAHLLLFIPLVIGLGITIYLVTSKGFFTLKSKASIEPVSFTGPTVTYQNNQYYTTSLGGVKLQLISPLTAPTPQENIPTPAPTPQEKLVPSPATNLLQGGDLESSSAECYSGSAWKRFRPSDLTKDEKEISTHETHMAIYPKSQFASSGKCYLAFNCGNYTSCIPGQSVYQDVDASNLPDGTTISYGGKFAVAEDQGPGKINFSIFEIGPASGAIAHEHREAVDKNYKLIQGSFVLNKDAKTLRYQFYLDTPSTFRADDMYIGPTQVLGIAYTADYYTTQFKWAKSLSDLEAATPQIYDSEPKIISYTFSSSAPNTAETVFVEFIGKEGERVRKQATITYAPPDTTSPALSQPPIINKLINGGLESGSISPWQRFRPSDLTQDKTLISTYETNWSVVNKPSSASGGNYYLAVNCGNNTSCIPGQNIYQDVDASSISSGTKISFGGRFAVTGDSNGRLALVVFEHDQSGKIIANHRKNLTVTPAYQLFQEDFVLNSQTKSLRYTLYLDSVHTFNLDEMFLGYGTPASLAVTQEEIISQATKVADRYIKERAGKFNWGDWHDSIFPSSLVILKAQLVNLNKQIPSEIENIISQQLNYSPSSIWHGDDAQWALANSEALAYTTDLAKRQSLTDKTNPAITFVRYVIDGSYHPEFVKFGWSDYGPRYWQDDLFMVTPWMARLNSNLAYEWIEAYAYDHRQGNLPGPGVPSKPDRQGYLLYNPANGLWRHDLSTEGYERDNWGRGNGWVAMGLGMAQSYLRQSYTGNKYKQVLNRSEIQQMLAKMANYVAFHQLPEGGWSSDLRQVEDKQISTDATAMLIFLLARGINEGWLDKDKFFPEAIKAWTALQKQIDEDGVIYNIQPANVKPSVDRKNSNDLQLASRLGFGVGVYEIAASEMTKLLGESNNVNLQSVSVQQVGKKYDLNEDNKVNSLDVSYFFAAWGKAKVGAIDNKADFNGDGVINSQDYSLIVKNISL